MNRKQLLIAVGCLVVLAAALVFIWRPWSEEHTHDLAEVKKPAFDADPGDTDERPIGADEKDWKTVTAEELGLKWIEPTKDPETGFIVGGKNPTSLIPKLKEIRSFHRGRGIPHAAYPPLDAGRA